MHATVLYRRNRLVEANGFDESLPRCEDYDLYLRLAQKFQIAGHPVTVAEYRWHDRNMSRDHHKMLRTILAVFDRHESRVGTDAAALAAIRQGRAIMKEYYVSAMLEDVRHKWRSPRALPTVLNTLFRSILWSPRVFNRLILHGFRLIVSKAPGYLVKGW